MLEVNEKTIESLQKVIEGLLLKMGVKSKIFTKISESEDKEMVNVNIKTDEADLLIGFRGTNLSAFQHLARILFARANKNEIVPFIIDVNDYKTEKEFHLKNIAESAAKKAKITKKEVVLPPMRPFERRVIHVFLSEDKEIKTESEGEEPERRIVIKPTLAKTTLEQKIADVK
jgi:spoIIIJ-associated protein